MLYYYNQERGRKLETVDAICMILICLCGVAIGLAISSVIFFSYSKPSGVLRIEKIEDDEPPYMFLEIPQNGLSLRNKERVVFTVESNTYSQK